MIRSTRVRLRIGAALAGFGLLLAAAGCSSQSVGSAAGSAAPSGAASSSSGGQFDSIIPKGDIVAASKDLVSKSLAGNEGFVPPSGGPQAQKPGAKIAFVAGDLSNGGHNSVSKSVTEAAKVMGWTVSVYDGQGNAQGNSDAMNQAITAQPAAIILGGLDPTEQAPAIKQATEAGIPVIGWHAGLLTGPGNGMVTNVSTEPLKVVPAGRGLRGGRFRRQGRGGDLHRRTVRTGRHQGACVGGLHQGLQRMFGAVLRGFTDRHG